MTLQQCQDLSPKECFEVIAHGDPCSIIDVRTGDEFSRSHLKGAENIDYFLPDFKDRLKTRDRLPGISSIAGGVTGGGWLWSSCGSVVSPM
jgi:hypothetical protein